MAYVILSKKGYKILKFTKNNIQRRISNMPENIRIKIAENVKHFSLQIGKYLRYHTKNVTTKDLFPTSLKINTSGKC